MNSSVNFAQNAFQRSKSTMNSSVNFAQNAFQRSKSTVNSLKSVCNACRSNKLRTYRSCLLFYLIKQLTNTTSYQLQIRPWHLSLIQFITLYKISVCERESTRDLIGQKPMPVYYTRKPIEKLKASRPRAVNSERRSLEV